MEKVPFSQLSEDRQWEIVENRINDWWADCLIEEVEKELEQLGFEEPKISFSGFWSQGDGASFVCKRVDFVQLLPAMGFKSKTQRQFEEIRAKLEPNDIEFLNSVGLLNARKSALPELLQLGIISGWVHRENHRYVHERTTELDWETENYTLVEEQDQDLNSFDITDKDAEELQELIDFLGSKTAKEWLVDLNRSIYSRLEEEWEATREHEHEHLMEEDEAFRVSTH